MLAAVVVGSTVGLAGCSKSDNITTPTATDTLTLSANTSTTVSPTDTPTQTPTAKRVQSDRLVVEGGETVAEAAGVYDRIVWEDTGQLVIEDGAGLELTEAE
ncbi:hypothetical protein [Haloarcula laminariae]|uniref:hypothetical protein n=1 Tax=Haloarcula laminariae TaxID=2961577 RepID=UPI0021C91631|nr:hypothetical protein [Halomicroarcula laminariae]